MGSAPASGRTDPRRLFTPDRQIWRVDRETVLLLGAGRALLLQLAHPLVAAGVLAHSAFGRNRVGRLRRTLDTSYALVFGDLDAARAAVRRMDRMHARVHGVLPKQVGRFPAGTPYDALDPALRLWVHATLIDTSLAVFQRFVTPLSRVEETEYYGDSRAVARLLGVPDVMIPATLDEFRGYVGWTLARDIAVGPTARALARLIFRPRGLASLAPVGALLEPITVGLLPADVRRQFGYGWGPAREQLLDVFAAAVRAVLPVIPPLLRVAPAARTVERGAGPRWRPAA